MICTSNAFDTLGDLDEEHVVSLTIDVVDSPSNITIVENINELESQMIEGKLVLLDDDDDGKPLSMKKELIVNLIWLMR